MGIINQSIFCGMKGGGVEWPRYLPEEKRGGEVRCLGMGGRIGQTNIYY